MIVSKSQLAIEYSYRIRDQHPETWIFWVHASSAARFEESFHEIADRLKIANRRDVGASIFALVYDWLQSNEKWMVILDNLDDDGFLHERRSPSLDGQKADRSSAAERPLVSFLPRSSKGTMIITTRSKDSALRIVDHNKLIEVLAMDTLNAVALLRTKLQLPAEEMDLKRLAKALDHMPLAIVQAAAYIRRRAPRYSVPRFLHEFEGSDEKGSKLLCYEAGHSQRDRDATNSILLSWQMSFDHIQKLRSSAANLLSLMSFFDRNGISENFLRLPSQVAAWGYDHADKALNSAEHAEKEYNAALGFSDDVALLKDFSFISIHHNTHVLMMHRLVQLATRQWLENRGESEKWREIFFRILSAKLQFGGLSHWTEYLSLSPHLKSALAQRPHSTTCLQVWASLLYWGAICLRGIGFFTDANKMATASLDTRQLVLGTAHPDTLQSMSILASTYWEAERWEEAEELELQLLEIRKRTLDETHPDVIRSMSSLALVYWFSDRRQKATALQVQAVKLHQVVLGVDHLTTLSAMHILASMYGERGQFRHSERLLEYVLSTEEEIFGVENESTLNSMSSLAITYRELGKLNDSESLLAQALEIRTNVLGREHPETLCSMIDLAMTYKSLGQLQRSEELLTQALTAHQEILGTEHRRTIRNMVILLFVYRDQGRFEEAENLAVQVLQRHKKVHGEEHRDTLIAMLDLARMYQHRGRWKEAAILQAQSLELDIKLHQQDNPTTLKIITESALLWKEQGESTRAFEILSECVAAQKRILGSDHPDTKDNCDILMRWQLEGLEIDANETDTHS